MKTLFERMSDAQAQANKPQTEALKASIIGGANSHCFDERIMLGGEDGECVAFSDPPWSERIVEALNTRANLEPSEAVVAERDQLLRERDTPQVVEFARAVQLEAWHQRSRWSADHDAGKTPFDWFWLVGYLCQKAASAAVAGDNDKALHHSISTAAALANWHLALSGGDNSMRPGIEPPPHEQNPDSVLRRAVHQASEFIARNSTLATARTK